MSFLVELPQNEYNLHAFARFVPTSEFDVVTAPVNPVLPFAHVVAPAYAIDPLPHIWLDTT